MKSILGIFVSIRSLLHKFRRRIDTRNKPTNEEDTPQQQNSECSNDRNDEAGRNDRNDEAGSYLYSVAWNAATEYFTSISAKFDGGPSFNNRQQNDNVSPSMQCRSKSTGNLQHLSNERSRALLLEMVAMATRGGMDVTLLPSDAQIVIFSYLPPQDVLAFTCTNRAGRNLLEDNIHVGGKMKAAIREDDNNSNDSDDIGIQITSGDTALLIWKALFMRDYAWVLSDWKIGKEAFMRSMTRCENQGMPQKQEQEQHNCSKSGRVFRHLTSAVLDSEHFDTFSIDDITTVTASSIHLPSMKEFYFTFAETWLNYTIAGCSTTEKCLIGLHGHVFDISNFVEDHPGSTETLLLQAGRDATVFFESMGHSLGARKLATGMCVVVNGQCIQRNASRGRVGERSCGLIKPSSVLDIKQYDATSFLIPRKRSRPRTQGGLYRIRERIRREEQLQLDNAARWVGESLGLNGLFGGVHVYLDPFCGWRSWHIDRDFNVVFSDVQEQNSSLDHMGEATARERIC